MTYHPSRDNAAEPEEFFLNRRMDRSPVHPGVILRDTLLSAMQLTTKDMAVKLRISRQTLHRILAGTTPISPQMALRLGKFCGNGPEIWLRMQQNHDLWQAERLLRAELRSIAPYRPLFAPAPYKGIQSHDSEP